MIAPVRGGSRLAPILSAIGIGLATFAWLNHVNPSFPIGEDGVRDQLMARDCTDLGQCHLMGSASFPEGFRHGAVWIDLLIAVRLLGGDTSSQRMVVLALLALSVATLFLVVWHWLRPSIALPAAVLVAAGLSLDTAPSMLVCPSVSAFPDILTASGLLCYGLSGRRRFLILSAFTLGMATSVHLASLSLVPSLVVIAVLGQPRPWRALLTSLGVLVATYFITARAALLFNLLALASSRGLMPVAAGALLVVLVSARAGSLFRRCSCEARAWLIGLILVLPFGLASLSFVFWQKHSFFISYLHPILGPAATLTGAILALPFEIGARRFRVLRWIPTALSPAAAMFVVFHAARAPSGPAQPWSLAEASAIADRVVKRGWVYEDLFLHLQGNACRELLLGMSMETPPPRAALSHGRRQMQVVKVADDVVPALAEPHDVVPLDRRKVAVVREIESWLRPESMIACRRPIGSAQSSVCSAWSHRALDALTSGRFLFATRSDTTQVHSLDLPLPYIAAYEIPLSPVAGESRDLTVMGDAAPDCSWHVTRTEGIQIEGQLPARHLRLHSDSGSPGLLVVEKPFGTSACHPSEMDSRYPPCLLETQPDDPLLAVAEAR